MNITKRLFSVIICFGVIFQFTLFPFNIAHATPEEMSEVIITDTADAYIEQQRENIRDILASCSADLNIDQCSENIRIGDSFVVYDLEKPEQEGLYYYPIMREGSDQIIALISLMDTSVGWQYTIDTNWVDELNSINYNKEDYIFYTDNGSLVAQSKKKKKMLTGKGVKDDFDNKSLETKKKIMRTKFKWIKKIDVEEKMKRAKNLPLGYTPTTTNELGYYYCNLYNGQGQGPYGLCWAASVATVANYLNGTAYTAKNVADMMGKDYNAGGFPEEIATAINNLGSRYYYTYQTQSFKTIMRHIGFRKPMVICGWNSTAGHAVTIYGYRNLANGQYVMIWNSALNNNTGGVSITTYSSSGMTFATGSNVFTWGATTLASGISYK